MGKYEQENELLRTVISALDVSIKSTQLYIETLLHQIEVLQEKLVNKNHLIDLLFDDEEFEALDK